MFNAYLINENHNKKYTRLFHSHDNELELYYVYSGKGYYIVGGRPYAVKAGDMVICNARTLHGDEPIKDSQMLSYCCALTGVSIKGLPENCLIDKHTTPVVSCGAMAEKVGGIMELIYLFSSNIDHLGDLCTSLSVSILLLIYQLLDSRARHKKDEVENPNDAVVKRIQDYLDTHYKSSLTLEMIGHALNMSPSFLSHVFKNATQISPIQYVIYRRFGEAQSLLIDTDISIGEIADLLGFNSISHFSAMFRKHVGLSPFQYKKSMYEMNHR